MNLPRFKSKKDEVLNHWIAFADNFSYPPQEFYAAIEEELEFRHVPGLKKAMIEYAEGGLLSGNRTYLRMMRERLAFDMCASPFGTGYFFSCRTVFSPAVVKLWHLLVLILSFGVMYNLLQALLGSIYAGIAILALLAAIAQVFRNAVALNLSDLDASLLSIPVLGPVYERWFRVDTYFRQDTRLIYLETIPKVVEHIASEVTAAKGVKLVRQYQVAPVLGDLYKPILPPQLQLDLGNGVTARTAISPVS
jgi:hypothetical protein